LNNDALTMFVLAATGNTFSIFHEKKHSLTKIMDFWAEIRKNKIFLFH
jgi:hypothetical protein